MRRLERAGSLLPRRGGMRAPCLPLLLLMPLLLIRPLAAVEAAPAASPADEAVRQGSALFEAKRFEEAYRAGRDGAAAHPGDANLLLLLGKSAYATQRYEEAAGAFEQALALRANDPGVRVRLAEAYQRSAEREKDPARARSLRRASEEQYRLAYTHLKEAAPQYPGNAVLFKYLGKAAQGLGRHAEAFAAYEQTLKIEPEVTENHYNLASAALAHAAALAAGGEAERAREAARTAMAQFRWILDGLAASQGAGAVPPAPGTPAYTLFQSFQLPLARAALLANEPGAAVQAYAALAACWGKTPPGTPELRKSLVQLRLGQAGALAASNETAAAVKLLDATETLLPDDAGLWAEWAAARAARGETEASRRAYGRALELRKAQTEKEPENAAAWYALAQLAVRAGDLPVALGAYERVASLSKDQTAYKARLEWAALLETQGEKKRGREIRAAVLDELSAAAAQNPEDVGLQYTRALAARSLGRVDVAAEAYERILAVEPDQERVRWEWARALAESGQAGRAREAYAALADTAEKRLAEEPESVEWKRRLATARSGAGEHEAAAGIQRQILERDPADAAARLGLASALYVQRDFKSAAAELRRVRDSAEDPQLRQGAEALLARAEEAGRRQKLSGRVAVSYTRDSNVTAAPVSNTVELGRGKTSFTLDPVTALKRKDYNVGTSAYLSHTLKLPNPAWEWRTTAAWFMTAYEDVDDQDANFYALKTGPGARLLGRLDVELLATLTAFEQDFVTYSKSHGLQANARYFLTPQIVLGSSLSWENKKYYRDRDRDAMKYGASFSPMFFWGENGQNALLTGFNYEREIPEGGAARRNCEYTNNNLRRDAYKARTYRIRYSRSLPWGLKPYAQYSFRCVEYDLRNPLLFAHPRFDRVHTAGAGFSKELPCNWVLEFDHSRIHSHSNSELYNYRRNTTTLTVAKEF